MFKLGSRDKDRVFYDAFEKHATCVVRAARLFLEALHNPERAIEISKQVRTIEAEGDTITHDTIARLHKIWITPFDRADIHALISALDDVLDMTEAAADRLALYEIKSAPDFAVGLTTVLVQATEAMERAVRLLHNVKEPAEMLKLCVEINRLENDADSDYRRGLATLFKGGFDAADVFKWRDIIDNLEAATDRCEDVANILEGIILEYS
jgi:predicted phosphate transport protein (TIGR00153 family)